MCSDRRALLVDGAHCESAERPTNVSRIGDIDQLRANRRTLRQSNVEPKEGVIRARMLPASGASAITRDGESMARIPIRSGSRTRAST